MTDTATAAPPRTTPPQSGSDVTASRDHGDHEEEMLVEVVVKKGSCVASGNCRRPSRRIQRPEKEKARTPSSPARTGSSGSYG